MIVQGSPEWHSLRCGRVTASRVADVVARTKSGWGASRANYMAELIAERLTGCPAVGFTNAAMAWGTEQEPFARRAYAAQVGADVSEIGFVSHPEIAMTGCSPDGLIGEDGLVELKAPNTATHLDTLLGETIPAKYVTQMQWQMACTGRDWCDWVSFDPRMPAWGQLYIARIPYNDGLVEELVGQVREFLDEVARAKADLEQYYKKAQAA